MIVQAIPGIVCKTKQRRFFLIFFSHADMDYSGTIKRSRLAFLHASFPSFFLVPLAARRDDTTTCCCALLFLLFLLLFLARSKYLVGRNLLVLVFLVQLKTLWHCVSYLFALLASSDDVIGYCRQTERETDIWCVSSYFLSDHSYN